MKRRRLDNLWVSNEPTKETFCLANSISGYQAIEDEDSMSADVAAVLEQPDLTTQPTEIALALPEGKKVHYFIIYKW